MERLKIMFQVTNEKFSLRGFPSTILHICHTEGFLALWKGHLAAILRVFPYSGIQFGTFDAMKRWAASSGAVSSSGSNSSSDPHLSVSMTMFCGGTAGAVSSIATYPLDLTRARLAIIPRGVDSKPFRLFRYIKKWYAEGGIFELYKGLTPTLLGVIPYGAIAFTVNEAGKKFVVKVTKEEPLTWHKLLCGALAGMRQYSIFDTYAFFSLSLFPSLSLSLSRSLSLFLSNSLTHTHTHTYIHTHTHTHTHTYAHIYTKTHARTHAYTHLCSVFFSCLILQLSPSVGLAAQSVTYPFEVLRRRMQTAGVLANRADVKSLYAVVSPAASSGTVSIVSESSLLHCRRDLNMMTCLQGIITEQGVRGLFKGLSLNYIKGPIAISISFVSYDFLKTNFFSS